MLDEEETFDEKNITLMKCFTSNYLIPIHVHSQYFLILIPTNHTSFQK